MCEETGPPTQADEDWYWARVAIAQDVPPARNKQPEPMEGQMDITMVLSEPGRPHVYGLKNQVAEHHCWCGQVHR